MFLKIFFVNVRSFGEFVTQYLLQYVSHNILENLLHDTQRMSQSPSADVDCVSYIYIYQLWANTKRYVAASGVSLVGITSKTG